MSSSEKKASRHTLKLALYAIVMFGFGYALIPLYNAFCTITGLNGKPENVAVAEEKAEVTKIDASRVITVEFLATANTQLPWEFRSETNKIKIHPGETTKAVFYVRNLDNHKIVGRAVPSISPGLAAKHLHKTECFCFTEQPLEAGEEREMPVVFYIDSKLPLEYSSVILSYTFFNVADKNTKDSSG
ncbi:cytochrome c oxidase assembly protein [Candidatus Nitrosacidococcus sp. I8]|uniref:cytochrome c oxidase assembly protein n=1 Tax=Candidatus Nitrosacidococcus sp. I8 TaxID=2942908 RepID=UPI002225B7F3|nr:cytochrome c oxidase assembly protein [Candidatus Nitrosacidococcus sp. I8]CAH9019853.1 Cytochrome c oxidase assembly protein CtaG [Candidatus Nitrosacidococcus sp. I8]